MTVALTPTEHGQILGAHIKGRHDARPEPLCERCAFRIKRCAGCSGMDYGPLQRIAFSEIDPIRAKADAARRKRRNADEKREFWQAVRDVPEGVVRTAPARLGPCAGCDDPPANRRFIEWHTGFVRRGKDFYHEACDPIAAPCEACGAALPLGQHGLCGPCKDACWYAVQVGAWLQRTFGAKTTDDLPKSAWR